MAGWKFLPRCGPTWAHSRRSIPRVDLSRCKMRADRRGDGAVERAGLENRNTRKRIVGSNPTLSAKTHPSKSQNVPENPISLYVVRSGVLTCPGPSGKVQPQSVGRSGGRHGVLGIAWAAKY